MAIFYCQIFIQQRVPCIIVFLNMLFIVHSVSCIYLALITLTTCFFFSYIPLLPLVITNPILDPPWLIYSLCINFSYSFTFSFWNPPYTWEHQHPLFHFLLVVSSLLNLPHMLTLLFLHCTNVTNLIVFYYSPFNNPHSPIIIWHCTLC